MCVAPAMIACTSVNTLRPGRAPPTRPTRRTIESINASRPSRCGNVANANRPALATRVGSSKVASIRSMVCDTRVTGSVSWLVERSGVEDQHRPSSGDLPRGYASYLTRPPSVDRGSDIEVLLSGGDRVVELADCDHSIGQHSSVVKVGMVAGHLV